MSIPSWAVSTLASIFKSQQSKNMGKQYWLDTIKAQANKGNVKNQEIDYTGIVNYINKHPNKKLSAEELKLYVDNNLPDIRNETYGAGNDLYIDDQPFHVSHTRFGHKQIDLDESRDIWDSNDLPTYTENASVLDNLERSLRGSDGTRIYDGVGGIYKPYDPKHLPTYNTIGMSRGGSRYIQGQKHTHIDEIQNDKMNYQIKGMEESNDGLGFKVKEPMGNNWSLFEVKKRLAEAIKNGNDNVSWNSGSMMREMWPNKETGFESFYDGDIVKRVNRFLKQYGSKVQYKNVKTADKDFISGTEKGAEHQMPFFKITKEMKEKITKDGGIPLFSAGGGLGLLDTPEGELTKKD